MTDELTDAEHLTDDDLDYLRAMYAGNDHGMYDPKVAMLIAEVDESRARRAQGTPSDPAAWIWTDSAGRRHSTTSRDIADEYGGESAAPLYLRAPGAVAAAPSIDAEHLARQAAWSERTFGPGRRTAGVVDHIRKELREVEADPDDLREWVDVVILALDGAWRTGASPQEIVDAVKAKQERNEGRTWPDWRTAPADRAIEHDRSGETGAVAAAPTEDEEAEAERLAAHGGSVALPWADLTETQKDAWRDRVRHRSVPPAPSAGEDEAAVERADDARDPDCVAAWPDAESGTYDPRCCRFPKSCSADSVTPARWRALGREDMAQRVEAERAAFLDDGAAARGPRTQDDT